MLVVKFELWPNGREDRKRIIAQAAITNLGEGDQPGTCNYSAILESVDSLDGTKRQWTGKVYDFPQAEGPMSLLSEAVIAMLSDEENVGAFRGYAPKSES